VLVTLQAVLMFWRAFALFNFSMLRLPIWSCTSRGFCFLGCTDEDCRLGFFVDRGAENMFYKIVIASGT
jgi:hypothetical protein